MNHKGAGILLKTKDDRYLLVQEAKVPNKWGFPKGHTEDVDTSPLDTARRELREETGLAPSSYTVTKGPFQILKGEEYYWFFEAEVLPEEEAKISIQDTKETLSIQWVSKADLIHPPFWLQPNKYLDVWSQQNRVPICLID
jgi:8-oxo-dGTP pyrophosphatase MutT (NUDIX family)